MSASKISALGCWATFWKKSQVNLQEVKAAYNPPKLARSGKSFEEDKLNPVWKFKQTIAVGQRIQEGMNGSLGL
jgi:hypothetical protein